MSKYISRSDAANKVKNHINKNHINLINQTQITSHFDQKKMRNSEISVGLMQSTLQGEYINPFSNKIKQKNLLI